MEIGYFMELLTSQNLSLYIKPEVARITELVFFPP